MAAPKQNTTADVSEPNLGFCYVIQYRVSRKRLLFPRSRSHAKPSYPVRGQLLRDSGAKKGGGREPRGSTGAVFSLIIKVTGSSECREGGGGREGPRTIRGRVFHNYYNVHPRGCRWSIQLPIKCGSSIKSRMRTAGSVAARHFTTSFKCFKQYVVMYRVIAY